MFSAEKENQNFNNERFFAASFKEIADTAYDKEDYSVAETNYRKAAGFFSGIGNSHQASFCYESAGASAYHAGDMELSIRDFETALLENECNASALEQLGFILQEKDHPWSDIKRSISCYQTALALFKENKNQEKIFDCAKSLSSIFYEESQWAEALEYSQIALQNDSIAVEKPQEWIYALVMAAHSSKNIDNPDYSISVKYFQQLVALMQEQTKKDDPDAQGFYELINIASCQVAEVEIKRGNQDAAAQWYIHAYSQNPSSSLEEKINMLGYVLREDETWEKKWNPAVEFKKLQDSLQNIQDSTDNSENTFEPLLQNTSLLNMANDASESARTTDSLSDFRKLFNKISNKEQI